mgnify:CR=1 FL=1
MNTSEIKESSLSEITASSLLTSGQTMFAPPWLRSGTINMLFAPTGAGKSHWAFNLSLAVAGGLDWLGQKCTKAKVLYIDGEMGGDAWVRRLSGNFVTGSLDKTFKMLSPDNFKQGIVPPLSDKRNHAFYLEKCARFDVIFIDNYITCCLPTTGEDSDIGLFLVLKDLLVKLKRMGKAIVLIHHTNKGGTDQHGTVYKDVIMDTIFRLRKWPRQYLDNGLSWEVKVVKDRNNFFEKKEETIIDIIFGEKGVEVFEGDISNCRKTLASDLLDRGYNKNNIADELKISINKVLDILNLIKLESRVTDDPFDYDLV